MGNMFTFKSKEYTYFYHQYNETWKKERIIEIPIIWEIVQQYNGKSILEIGNVLKNYFQSNHDVVDLYDNASGVINQDVIEYNPNKKYDLIVSISTLEHVGWEVPPQIPDKAQKSIEHLKTLLNKNGVLAVTLPFGYHTVLDKAIINKTIEFNEYNLMKRIGYSEWTESEFSTVNGDTYDKPYGNANELFIGIYVNKEKINE
jgi:hypothetical protein